MKNKLVGKQSIDLEDESFDNEGITIENEELPIINKDGNIEYETNIFTWYLSRTLGNIGSSKISKNYFYIEPIGNDHYIVCDITTTQEDLLHSKNLEEKKLKYGYGVIRLNRDHLGNIIPMGETIVIPPLFDEIIPSESQTIIVSYNGKKAYIDIDLNGHRYGQQLTPITLKTAEPFDKEYPRFAKCSIDGTTGYIPRAFHKSTITSNDLIPEETVKRRTLVPIKKKIQE